MVVDSSQYEGQVWGMGLGSLKQTSELKNTNPMASAKFTCAVFT